MMLRSILYRAALAFCLMSSVSTAATVEENTSDIAFLRSSAEFADRHCFGIVVAWNVLQRIFVGMLPSSELRRLDKHPTFQARTSELYRDAVMRGMSNTCRRLFDLYGSDTSHEDHSGMDVFTKAREIGAVGVGSRGNMEISVYDAVRVLQDIEYTDRLCPELEIDFSSAYLDFAHRYQDADLEADPYRTVATLYRSELNAALLQVDVEGFCEAIDSEYGEMGAYLPGLVSRHLPPTN